VDMARRVLALRHTASVEPQHTGFLALPFSPVPGASSFSSLARDRGYAYDVQRHVTRLLPSTRSCPT